MFTIRPGWPDPARALRLLGALDAAGRALCPACEGLLIAAAMGVPIPPVVEADGRVEDGPAHLARLLDRVERRLAPAVAA